MKMQNMIKWRKESNELKINFLPNYIEINTTWIHIAKNVKIVDGPEQKEFN